MDKVEPWSKFNCFHTQGMNPRLKTCQCLESLHGIDKRKNCVTDYIRFWARLDKVPRQMIVIENLTILNDGPKNRNKSCIVPFVPCQLIRTNKFITNEFICKEALGTLFGYGHITLKALVFHAKNHTFPINRSTGRVDPSSAKFQENVLPSLAHFFKKEIVPLAGARPTRYTRDAVICTTIEREMQKIYWS